MSEKLCVFCKNFKIQGGYPDTHGYGGEDYMMCLKNRQLFGIMEGEEDGFRQDLLFAEKCPDYDEVDK